MAEDSRAEEQVEEKDTQPSESPTEEQKTPSEPDVSPEGEAKEDDVPEGLSEKAQERFRSMSKRIKELEQERSSRKESGSVFDSLRPKETQQVHTTQMAPQYQNLVQQQGFVDQDGYVDVDKFQTYLRQLEGTVAQTQQQTQTVARQTKDLIDEEKAKARYPEMDPESDTFDPAFEEEVAKEWLLQMMKDPNKASVSKAASTIKRKLSSGEKKQAEKVREETLKEVTSKEQASREAIGRSDQRTKISAERVADLDRRVREGDRDALAARISAFEKSQKPS